MNDFEKEIDVSLEHYKLHGKLVGERVQEKRRYFTNVSFGTSPYDFWVLRKGVYFASRR